MTDATIHLPIKRLAPSAILPTYGSAFAAGMDLHALLPVELPDQGLTIAPGERKLIQTGISVAIPAGWYGRVAPRSGLAYKHGIDVLAGVIDSDYRGEIGVILLNTGSEAFVVRHGDRIAQLVIERAPQASLVEVDDLPATDRGAGGFGSTGVAARS